jgi:hypothetical protein
MRLTLLKDGDIGTPVSNQHLDDHPDATALKEALDEMAKDAKENLIDAPAREAKAREDAAKAEEEATTAGAQGTKSSTSTSTSSSTKSSS